MNEPRKYENVNIQPLSDSDLDKVSGGVDDIDSSEMCPLCGMPATITHFAGIRSHCSCSYCGKDFMF